MHIYYELFLNRGLLDRRVRKEAAENRVQSDLLAKKDHQGKWAVLARKAKTVQQVFLAHQVQQVPKECLDHPESREIVEMTVLLDLPDLLVLLENQVDEVQEELKVLPEPLAQQGLKVRNSMLLYTTVS